MERYEIEICQKIEHRASGIGDKSVLLAALTATLLSLAPLEQSQAQLYIDIYPSQDHTNQTLWIFSGSSTASLNNRNIRTSASSNYSGQDSWGLEAHNDGNIYDANQPSNTNFSLPPCFPAPTR